MIRDLGMGLQDGLGTVEVSQSLPRLGHVKKALLLIDAPRLVVKYESIRCNRKLKSCSDSPEAVVVFLTIEELEILFIEEADRIDDLFFHAEAEAMHERHARQEIRQAPPFAGEVDIGWADPLRQFVDGGVVARVLDGRDRLGAGRVRERADNADPLARVGGIEQLQRPVAAHDRVAVEKDPEPGGAGCHTAVGRSCIAEVPLVLEQLRLPFTGYERAQVGTRRLVGAVIDEDDAVFGKQVSLNRLEAEAHILQCVVNADDDIDWNPGQRF